VKSRIFAQNVSNDLVVIVVVVVVVVVVVEKGITRVNL